ncbi:MAG: Zn-ribbon domain-containing OB-fold protein [Halobacteriaceae archaeon]
MSEQLPPDIDHDQLTFKQWKKALVDGILVGQECQECGFTTGTPKQACVECSSRDLQTITLPTTGTVHSETTINISPSGFDHSYQVGVIDLGEARVLGRINGEVSIGDEVSFTEGKRFRDEVAPVFEPS